MKVYYYFKTAEEAREDNLYNAVGYYTLSGDTLCRQWGRQTDFYVVVERE